MTTLPDTSAEAFQLAPSKALPPMPSGSQPCWATVAFVIGPPGAGKGTICKMLAETLDLCHISVGDLLREYCTRTDLEPNPTIVQHVQDETLVPFDILKPIIFEAMERERARPNGKEKFLIDGFPRSIEQAVLAADAFRLLDVCISIKCTENTAKARFLARDGNRPKGTMKSFKKRYAEYQKNDRIVWSYYHQLQCLLEVSSEGVADFNLRMLMRRLSQHDSLLVKDHHISDLKLFEENPSDGG